MQQQQLDLLEFQDRFPDEQTCQEYLFKQSWPNGYRCPKCGHDQASFHSTKNLYQSKACRYQTSVTAGTIFHKTRTSLRKWFWMILFLARQKSGVSILSLQRSEIRNQISAKTKSYESRFYSDLVKSDFLQLHL